MEEVWVVRGCSPSRTPPAALAPRCEDLFYAMLCHALQCYVMSFSPSQMPPAAAPR
eukprot:CAMPEP_0174721312 /NCGR_PEP_ID=MMETSP1094-20130205/35875_1 /TAXON_ID=156173 /ORGANISM="Chrysochromulina brevifilum, Strain UTEX LB 985" /LENGTH=55 /DNA_ID=CAMNT_0015921973 /DNA_START=244 /DNA_END=407 /DNA_ORIENTATION=+